MPTLGLGFEGLLYRGALADGALPALRVAPAPGAIDFLLRAAETFQVAVYPLRPARGRAAAIQYWAWHHTRRYLEKADHPAATKAADRLIELLVITEHRLLVDLSLEAASFWNPGEIAELPAIDELLARARRAKAWRCAA